MQVSLGRRAVVHRVVEPDDDRLADPDRGRRRRRDQRRIGLRRRRDGVHGAVLMAGRAVLSGVVHAHGVGAGVAELAGRGPAAPVRAEAALDRLTGRRVRHVHAPQHSAACLHCDRCRRVEHRPGRRRDRHRGRGRPLPGRDGVDASLRPRRDVRVGGHRETERSRGEHRDSQGERDPAAPRVPVHLLHSSPRDQTRRHRRVTAILHTPRPALRRTDRCGGPGPWLVRERRGHARQPAPGRRPRAAHRYGCAPSATDPRTVRRGRPGAHRRSVGAHGSRVQDLAISAGPGRATG